MESIQSSRRIMTGNEAVATGVKLSNVKVISAYPITPQTTIVEKLAEMVANGELDAKYIEVESEHSAMASVTASEITGVRSYTASSSHGILYMHENLHWASGMRVPIVMSVVNRAIGPPWSIWGEQTETFNQRDTGWLQIYCESNQEAMDSIILGYKIAENKKVLLPVMNMLDAFTLSHTSEPVDVRNLKTSYDYLGDLDLDFKLDFKNPAGYGSLVAPDGPFMEMRKDMRDSMYNASGLIKSEISNFNEVFDAELPGLTENFMMEDADYALITAGAISSTAKYTVRKLRERGQKVGLIRLYFYRPFPGEEILKAVRGLKGLGVVERNVSYGQRGPTFEDVVSALYRRADVPIRNYVVGLGGRDIRVKDYEKMFENLIEGDNDMEWINVAVR
ncbi:MAG: pyruvate ferredoxin oxidoreductase [Thermoplasmatales archaeon]|nr:pyruvate ferredoxin oxidoreductase [Candidatus Thermoplasmatota archaeon]MCL6003492.1 pyruvate ferredoxin oxidoreductase [Candidatus Thermoplasmatota archaeon]MDA8054421.1 pyruvate ferredoxin oxidoreductase [Thermoplasmatales archaeon]